ncbi:MAG: DUF1150 family protein [Pseudomonadota bacterium]
MDGDRSHNSLDTDFETGSRTVYVRTVAVEDVLHEIADDPDFELVAADTDTLYAVHATDGSRLALVSDRETAFAAARMYDMAPVSVH